MRRLILLISGISLFLSASAQEPVRDWALTNTYSKANEEVASRPVAVYFGDSLTECWWMDKEFFIDNNFLARGISGQTSCQLLVRFRKDVIDMHPKYVVILCGTNDLAENIGPVEPETIVGNIKSMCELAKANKIKPIVCSVTPSNLYPWTKDRMDPSEKIIELNKLIEAYARQTRIPYVDYHSALKNDTNGLPEEYTTDGCHLTMSAYKIMESIVVKYIKQGRS